MLGTLSFEPYFKSYPCFTFRSLEISEIAKQPVFPFPCLPTYLLTATVQSAARPPWRAASPRHLLPASFHASRLSLPPPSFPRTGAYLAVPRRSEPSRGRHLTVAVASSMQCPGSHLARASAPGESPHSFPLVSSPASCPKPPEHHRPSSATPASSSHRRTHSSALPRP